MKNQKNIFMILLILSLCFLFYWFQYRPSQIRSYCSWSVRWEKDGPRCKRKNCYDEYYKMCIRDRGLK